MFVPRSEAQKRADRKYKDRVEATLTVCVKREEAEAFRAVCAEAGKSVNAVLAEYVRSKIEAV